MQKLFASETSLLRRGKRALLAGLVAFALLNSSPHDALAQGCVAVRGTGMLLRPLEGATPADADLAADDWLASLSYRYLHSHRHFVGDVEQTQRQTAANEVINHSHFLDLGVQYAFTPRWSVGVTFPVVFSDRSSLAPTNFFRARYYTFADGIGDMRFTGYAWLWDPKSQPKGNIQIGIGLKVPTGDDGSEDTFYTANGLVVRPVDQSIQPGDGGWGFSVELNAYREIFPRTVAFLQASYLFNPQGDNGVLTWRDNNSLTPGNVTAAPSSASYYEHFMSIPDQYFARGGLSYTLVPKWGLSVNLAGRLEGIPVRDLLGSSTGFRRPGFAAAIEPGLEIMKGRYTFNLSVPFAVYRNRERSLADQRASDYRIANPVTGQNPDVHGDAAFADQVVTASIAVRF
ncbi:MAG: hypothetical protein HY043_24590 [Verrucomicrobia bacterium]|nr:hypothetical protein [Verrucomicrobiota bacterium]